MFLLNLLLLFVFLHWRFFFELIERQNLLADVSSVAIFVEGWTEVTHVGMEDGGGSNPSSTSTDASDHHFSWLSDRW